jgi:polysaccharide export outer membrane protein
VVEEDSRKFTALGATGAPGLVPFESETLSAIEAIATVGGLQTRGRPDRRLRLPQRTGRRSPMPCWAATIWGDQRMVYVLDLTQPNGMFEARDFLIRDGDTVYVTEAPYVQWNKTLSALTGATGAAATSPRPPTARFRSGG